MTTHIALGQGQYVVNYGTFADLPAVFIEPASEPGPVGENADAAALPKTEIHPKGFVITFQSRAAANVLMDAIRAKFPPSQGERIA